ncbi:hypothetical protein BH23PLA1_BH23PLA1_02970 [soil metagenome]
MSMAATRWRFLLLLLPLAWSAGCDWIPVRRRLDPGLYPLKGRPSTDSATATAILPPRPRLPADGDSPPLLTVEPETLPTLPALRPISDEEALATPMLDAALVRAESLREAVMQRFDQPEETVEIERAILVLGELRPAASENLQRPPLDFSQDTPPLQIPSTTPEPIPNLSPIPPLKIESTPESGTTQASFGSGSDESLWQTVLQTLADAEVPEPVEIKSKTEREIESDSASSLRIADLRLCRSVRNFGKFEELTPADCRPGREVILYCELEGVGYEPIDDGFRSRISTTLELFSEPGGPPLWSDTRPAVDLCSRPRRDYFVNYLMRLPESLLGGTYQLRISQHDLVTDETAARTLPIAILP